MALAIIFILVVAITIITEQSRYIDHVHEDLNEIRGLVLNLSYADKNTSQMNAILKKYEAKK